MQSNFKLIFLVAFIAFAVLGVMVFAGVIPIGKSDQSVLQGRVTMWGTANRTIVNSLLDEFHTANPTIEVRYVQKLPETFNQDLLEALATGVGPDLFLLPNDLAYGYRDKIYTIPYSSYPIANFKGNFVTAGEVFLTDKGVIAFPLAVDPLVMYYNRSILDTHNIVYPPANWDELLGMASIINQRDENKQIIKSVTALGQFSNVNNAKDILSSLFMQMGNPIVSQNTVGLYRSNLNSETNQQTDLSTALSFYLSFANPLIETYSWNKSLPTSRDFFSADNLAFYFGFASELQTLINKNPNQNFSVAPLPQIKNTNTKVTYARVTGIAISSFSKNLNTAYGAANLLAFSPFAHGYAERLGLTPARRDLLAQGATSDTYRPIFYSSALYARSWLDPAPTDTDNVFRSMVESVLSNNSSTEQAILNAHNRLNLLLIR